MYQRLGISTPGASYGRFSKNISFSGKIGLRAVLSNKAGGIECNIASRVVEIIRP